MEWKAEKWKKERQGIMKSKLGMRMKIDNGKCKKTMKNRKDERTKDKE